MAALREGIIPRIILDEVGFGIYSMQRGQADISEVWQNTGLHQGNMSGDAEPSCWIFELAIRHNDSLLRILGFKKYTDIILKFNIFYAK